MSRIARQAGLVALAVGVLCGCSPMTFRWNGQAQSPPKAQCVRHVLARPTGNC